MAATKSRTYVKRFQELEEIREKVEKDRIKSYMTEKNGIDNDTRKWFLIRILDIPRTYVESHVDHTHHETLEFLETCWCLIPDTSINTPVNSYKKDFMAKYHNPNQLNMTYFTHTKVILDISKAHTLEGRIQEILCTTANYIMPGLRKIESSLIEEIETLQAMRKYLINRLMYKVEADGSTNMFMPHFARQRYRDYKKPFLWEEREVNNNFDLEDRKFYDQRPPSPKTPQFRMGTRLTKRNPEHEQK